MVFLWMGVGRQVSPVSATGGLLMEKLPMTWRLKMSKQATGSFQASGLLLLGLSFLTDQSYPGGPAWFRPALQVGIALSVPLACYKDPKFGAAVLLAVGWTGIVFFHLRGWPSLAILGACLATLAYTGYNEFVASRPSKAT